MASIPALSLSNIVDITVTIAPPAASANQFNQGLVIGDSAVIPSYGSNPRIRQYQGPGSAALLAMLADGFDSADPEYIAAQIYFSQNPAPPAIWIGRQDGTAIQTAVPDGRFVSDGAMTASSDVLTSATADFLSGDIGKQVAVAGAGVGGVDLVTTIASVTNTTTAVLSVAASTTVSAAAVGIGALGESYKVNDLITVTQGGASNGVLTVLTLGPGGTVKTLGTTIGNQGTGYATANNLATTGGSGTGLEVNITAIGESLLQAAEACREASGTWYGLSVTGGVDADMLALAQWADPLWQTTRFYPWSDTVNIANGVTGNLALELQAQSLRVLGIYSTTQGGLAPNNIFAASGLMGVDMGLNTGLPGSYFISAHKNIAGIAAEPLTQTQYNNLKTAGFNALINLNGQYSVFEPGLMSNGAPSTLWLFLAMLVANLQINEMNVLASLPAVPQTNAGEQLLIQAANQACQFMVGIGFLAPGIWTGATIPVPTSQNPAIVNGQALPAGYLNVASPYSQQSSGDRAAGQAMPIVCAVITSGGTLSLAIGVLTQL